MAVCPRQKAQAQHSSSAVTPAAVQAVEEIRPCLCFRCLSQEAAQRLCLLTPHPQSQFRFLFMLLCGNLLGTVNYMRKGKSAEGQEAAAEGRGSD